MTAAEPTGLVVVDKPAGWTSHDVVARARRRLGTKRVGHAGTLDPDATGVLVLGVGRATRLLRYVSELSKSYEGEVVLGVETSTLDAAGEVVATHDMTGLSMDDVRAAAAGFVGEIDQVPPMVSARRVGGRRLHELARQGIEVDREARRVTVHRLVVKAGPEPGVLVLGVDCSSGTYVRSLAADLGRALGGGAHLRNLRRVAVGGFTLADACALEDLDRDSLRPLLVAVAHLDRLVVDDEVAGLVATGTPLARTGEAVVFSGGGPWAVVATTGELLAVYEVAGARAKPAVVLVRPEPRHGG